jgi:hypothetical protein
MFMKFPTGRGTIHLAAYATGAVLLSMAAGWSTFEVGATLIRMTNDAIIDGSGKPEPEVGRDAASATPAEPAPAETQPASTQSAANAATRVIVPPTRVSSDDSSSEHGHGYRTYCVRLCDGYYWPISYSAGSERLNRDAAACQSSCDSPARLFVHRMSGGGPATMVSLDGVPYASLKTAFQFRSQYDAQCRCKPQPWDEAATDQHRLFAATDAAKRGNQAAAAEAKRLSAKVEAERAQTLAARDAANARANRQLATVKPEAEHPRRERYPLGNGEAMGLGMAPSEPSRRGGFSPASGSGRAWTERVFGGN